MNHVLSGLIGLALGIPVAWLAYIVARRSWGKPGESEIEWQSALAGELTPARVEVIRLPPPAAPVHAHVGATEYWSPATEIHSAGETGDLVTFAEQLRGNDDWSGLDQALVDYENAMLTRREWRRGVLGVDEESTQQRIDRWLSEGGDGVRAARAEARQAVSDTWDAPSQELPVLHTYVADRMAEALLAS